MTEEEREAWMQIERKRLEIVRAIGSPAAFNYQVSNAKKIVSLASELVVMTSLYERDFKK